MMTNSRKTISASSETYVMVGNIFEETKTLSAWYILKTPSWNSGWVIVAAIDYWAVVDWESTICTLESIQVADYSDIGSLPEA